MINQSSGKPKQSTGLDSLGAIINGDAESSHKDEAGLLRMDMLGGSPELAPAPKKKSIPTHLLFAGGLVVVGGGLLFTMRQFGIGPLTSSAAVQQIEYDLNKAPGKESHERVLAELNASGVTIQVPADQVQKNPFKMPALLAAQDLPVTDDGPAAAPEDPAELERQRLAELKDSLEAEASELRINGIINGSVPVARINDEMRRIGDAIGSFTIVAIRAREVDIQAEGMLFTLTLDLNEDSGPTSKPRKK